MGFTQRGKIGASFRGHMQCMNISNGHNHFGRSERRKRKRNGLRIITLNSAVPFDPCPISPLSLVSRRLTLMLLLLLPDGPSAH